MAARHPVREVGAFETAWVAEMQARHHGEIAKAMVEDRERIGVFLKPFNS